MIAPQLCRAAGLSRPFLAVTKTASTSSSIPQSVSATVRSISQSSAVSRSKCLSQGTLINMYSTASKPPTTSSSDVQSHDPTYDPYPTTPTGLQTAYEKEAADIACGKRESLAEEMDKAMFQQEIDDGYEKSPIGMQTSFANEYQKGQQAGMSHLENELVQFDKATSEAQRGLGESHADEYGSDPIGLELSYRQEAAEIQDGRSKLEHELATRSRSFREASRGLGSAHADEFPEALQGLQTSYLQEQSGTMTLEQELAQKAREAHEARAGLGSTHHDEFPMDPQGLQESYRAEQVDIETGKRLPLEAELASSSGPAGGQPDPNSPHKGRLRS